MREILFKAKIKNWKEQEKENQWVEGYYCKRKSGRFTTVGFEEEYKDCIIKKFSDGGTTFCEVIPETVCQYTGINDKTKWEELTEYEQNDFLSKWNPKENRQNIKQDWKGRKIFENDIIECKRNNRHFQSQIEWDSTWGGFIFQDT